MLVALEPTLTDKADYLNVRFGRHPHRNPWQGRRKESTYRPERTRKRIPVTVGWRGHRSERCAGVGLKLRCRVFTAWGSIPVKPGDIIMGVPMTPCFAPRPDSGSTRRTAARHRISQQRPTGCWPRMCLSSISPFWWFARPPPAILKFRNSGWAGSLSTARSTRVRCAATRGRSPGRCCSRSMPVPILMHAKGRPPRRPVIFSIHVASENRALVISRGPAATIAGPGTTGGFILRNRRFPLTVL